jgi:SAM-dependent methyltransferase
LADYFEADYLRNDELLERQFGRVRDRILSLVAQDVHRRKKGGNILDIGCAGGYFLKRFFSGSRWELHGVEPSRLGAKRAEEKGIRVYPGQAHSVDLPGAYFDVVTAMDVFYYFFEPQRELSVIRNSLKPDGLLFIEVPLAEAQLLRNAGCTALLAGKTVKQWPLGEILYFFNRDSIRFVLEQSGFQVDAFLPMPGNHQGNLPKDLVFDGYYLASELAWHLSAHRLMLGPNFLAVASLKPDS